MSSSSRRARSELTEIDSRMFGIKDVTFLTPNNTAQLAHTGSTVTLSCRLTKTPNFGMVRHSQGCNKYYELYSISKRKDHL